ncbi:thermonuclease family protein [Algiphilus sp.]|uniref:thermonuclease family protein n=1 Tax=Algiphilus sp. TaxID=1872431 RepID=UPI003C5FAF7B
MPALRPCLARSRRASSLPGQRLPGLHVLPRGVIPRALTRLAVWLLVTGVIPGAVGAGIYRWHEDGVVHYGDRPPAGAEAIGESASEMPRKVEVARVIDGDTVALADGRRVRIIGIDAPEIARRGAPGEPGGLAASRFLQRLLDDVPVTVETGASARDDYDRLLAYLALPEGDDVGERMLRAGQAVVSAHPDNMQRIARYFAAEADARSAARGLWRRDAYRPRPARDAMRFRNSYRQLHGRVAGVRVGGSGAEIRLEAGLQLRVTEALLPRFDAERLRGLTGRRVLARGTVRQHDGSPVIRLRDPAQLTVR